MADFKVTPEEERRALMLATVREFKAAMAELDALVDRAAGLGFADGPPGLLAEVAADLALVNGKLDEIQRIWREDRTVAPDPPEPDGSP
jgi:hypothetical protein